MIYKNMEKFRTEMIYHKRMVNDFHPNELKPLSYMLKAMDEGLYFPMAVLSEDSDNFAEEDVLAYCFFVRANGCMLLDYFAVAADKRGTGIGSEIIRHFAKEGFMGEVEDAEYSTDEDDRQNRLKRLAFYERNGMKRTGLRCRLFGSDYVIMYCGEDMTDDEAYRKMQTIYDSMFDDKTKAENVFLRRV